MESNGNARAGEGTREVAARKTWRVVFEVETTVRDLTDDAAEKASEGYVDPDAPVEHDDFFWEHVGRQRRLLRAVLEDPAALEALLRFHACLMFGEGGEAERAFEKAYPVGTNAGPDAEREAIRSVLGRLSEEERRFFEEVEEDGALTENTFAFSRCLVSRIAEIEVAERGR